jgi:nitroreductase
MEDLLENKRRRKERPEMDKTKGKRRFSRGAFLKGAGSALVLVAGGGVWRAVDQGVFGSGQGPAYEPWADWREAEGPMALVSAAILAANAHNTQPWLFEVSDARIDLFADRSRDIGTVDPFLREMYIGLGCALENLLLSARANGYEYALTLAPDRSDPTHAARVDLSAGGKEISPLYEAIPDRHTNRYAYDTSRPVLRETLDALGALGEDDPEVEVFWFATGAERRKVGGLLVESTRAIIADEEQSYDNGPKWLRQDQDAIQRHRDGLTLDILGPSAFGLVAGKMLPEPSEQSSNEFWLRAIEERQAPTAAAFGILAVHDDRDDAQRLKAGRLWQRMHLWATVRGLAMQPMNQINERADREAQLGIEPRFGDALKELLGDPSWRGIFTFRVGYPTEQAPPSPRRAAGDVVME